MNRTRSFPDTGHHPVLGRVSRLEMRALLCEAQNWRCAYCQVEMVEYPAGISQREPADRRCATIEHLLTGDRRDRHDWENLVAACLRCNSGRPKREPPMIYYGCVQKKKAEPVVQRPRKRQTEVPDIYLARGSLDIFMEAWIRAQELRSEHPTAATHVTPAHAAHAASHPTG